MSGPILITGAQGFVGRYTVAACVRRWPGREIVGLGRSIACDDFTHTVTFGGREVRAPLTTELEPWKNVGVTYRRGDLRNESDVRAVVRSVRPSIVIHLASGLRDDPAAHLFSTNVEGTVCLLEALRELGAPLERVVLGSSGSVYGDAARLALPLNETSHCVPADLYAVSKLAAEQAARVVGRRELPLVAARIFNVLGPGQEERHVVGRVASQLAAIVAGRQEPYLDLGDTTTTRDFIDVRDVANALVTLAERGTESVYNVGSGRETSIETIVRDLLDISGTATRVARRASYMRPSDLPRYFGDVERLTNLGFFLRYDLRESLSDVFSYYVQGVAAG